MVEKSDRRRSEEIRVKLSPGMAAEFDAIAESRGLLPATLAASALGEFVERYRRDKQIAQMVAIDASKRMVEATSEGAVEKAITAILGDASLLELIARAGEPEAGSRAEAGQVPDRKPQPRSPGVPAQAGAPGGGDRVRTAT